MRRWRSLDGRSGSETDGVGRSAFRGSLNVDGNDDITRRPSGFGRGDGDQRDTVGTLLAPFAARRGPEWPSRREEGQPERAVCDEYASSPVFRSTVMVSGICRSANVRSWVVSRQRWVIEIAAG